MKRLKNKLLSMETNTTTYAAMYDGSMSVVDPAYPTMPPVMEALLLFRNREFSPLS